MKKNQLTPVLPAEETIPAVVPMASAVSLGTLQVSTPGALVSGAVELAAELARIIDRQNLAVTIQGCRYVRCEGWTTLGVMLGCVAREVSTVEKEGTYISTVELVRITDGTCVSRASAECGADEPTWKNRPRFARRSMAQTRATAKACRLAFSWVMALAGYEPTPAEEMEALVGSEPARPTSRLIRPPKENGSGNGQAKITPAQTRYGLEAKILELGLDSEWVRSRVEKRWGVTSLADLTQDQTAELLARLPKWAEDLARKGGPANGGAEPGAKANGNSDKPDPDPVAGLVENLLVKAKEIRHKARFADSSQARTKDEARAQEIEILAGKIEELSGQPRQLLGRALSGKHSSLEAARLRAEELADEEKAVLLEALEWAKVFQAAKVTP